MISAASSPRESGPAGVLNAGERPLARRELRRCQREVSLMSA